MAELESLKSQFESNVEDSGVKKEYFKALKNEFGGDNYDRDK